MAKRILILGASYGSLLATKLAMASHEATLVCRSRTTALINDEGTEIRIKLKGEDSHRSIRSVDLLGKIDANVPQDCQPSDYDMVVLAMQEPQYCHHALRTLLIKTAEARVPCLSIMNMPPLAYLRRIKGLNAEELTSAYTDPSVWDRFEPGLVTLCSPDPQAFRPPEEDANVLHVGLPTNFKAATFADPEHNKILHELAADIAAVTLDGQDVPVKLRVYNSLFVPMAKWAMLLTGNYRCVMRDGAQPIRDAVHSDIDLSGEIYAHVNNIAIRLGADPADLVPFEKYARAAESLKKPSSAARAILAGAPVIERVDTLVQQVAAQLGMSHPIINQTVATVDAALEANIVEVA